MKVQEKVAAVAVFVLGTLWGAYSNESNVVCMLGEELEGVVVRVERVQESNTQYRVQGNGGCTIIVTTTRWTNFLRGDHVRVTGQIDLISTLPEDLQGYANYLDRQGVHGTARFAQVERLEANTTSVQGSTIKYIRHRIESTLREPEASVAVAMLVADRGMVPDEVTDQFQFSGISHILAISGLHISILVGGLLVIGKLLPMTSYMRTSLVIAFLWVYVGVIGFPVSATRAAWFWSLTLLAFQVRALVSLATVFIVTIAGMISINPQIVFDVGFQLSFAAVAGIGVALFLTRKSSKAYVRIVAVPIGAALTTWPIVSHYFGILNIAGVVANIFAVPVVPIFLISALLAISVSSILPVIGYAVASIVHGMWSWISFVARTVSEFPGAYVVYVVPMQVIILWYAVLVSLVITIHKKQKRSWLEIWE